MSETIKYYLIVLLLLIICNCSIAKQCNNDSLQNVLSTVRTDSAKIDVLIALAKENPNTNFLKYINEALSLAEKINYKKGITACNAALGKYYYERENFSTSLLHFIVSYNYAREINDISGMAYACLYIGYNNYQNNPNVSLKYYKKSIDYCKLGRNRALEAYGHSAVGNIYESWRDGTTALKNYNISLKIRREVGSPNELVSSLIETARAFNILEQYDKSYELIKEGIKIAEHNKNNDLNLAYLYQMIGHEYSGRYKDYKTALEYFLKSYKIVTDNNFRGENSINSIKPIATMYFNLGDYKNSAAYFKLFNDSFNENQRRVNKELIKTEDILKEELEKEKLAAQNSEEALQKSILQKKEATSKLFLIAILFLVVLVFFIYRNNRLKEKLNVSLDMKVQERNRELAIANEKLLVSEKNLTAVNKELESFIYRTSHDLKGPLSSSRGLIGLAINSTKAEDVEDYLKLIQMSLDKLDAILVSLYEASIIRKGVIRLVKCDIETVINNLIFNFKGYANYDKIKFNIENNLKTDFIADEILTQTILRNVIENAVKYSQAGAITPYVNIVLSEDENYFTITIADNGIGIPEADQEKIFDVFYRANTVSKGSGLGLYIVQNAIDKLGGKIKLVKSKPNEGTTFSLYFPKNN